MEFLSQINWLAVIASGVITLFVGGLWYGPIAGKAWMEEVGLTKEEIEESGAPTTAMIKSFIATMIMAIGMSLLIGWSDVAVGDWLGGAQIGATVAILVVGGSVFPNYAFESKSLRHFIIHLGNITVSMALIGALLAAWR